MKIDNEYLNSNNIYDSLLSKDPSSNVFIFIESKAIILKTQTFYFFKIASNGKNNILII